ncbi:hypothetical protein K7640_23170 [Micromonospora sp. PLK6-60]|uniref:hypothetical protein n=1 Tax=Micromonospora sp. PLK6-60 TaxID=2873383 RepID=UPI001CA77854|nr:hypothetical protein [Micromonospora sp. PLK6-60]MBY8874734.1 hypothetical protein [Micromonospora sp. PLK6-60]
MIFRRPDRSGRPADRVESERMLDAARAPRPSDDPVARLLAAAAAPPSPREVAGEEQALAAFRAARRDPAPVPAGSPGRRRLTTGAVAWIAGVAAATTAGVAFAAVTIDREPGPPPGPATSSPAPSGETSGGAPTGGSPSGGSTTDGTPPGTGGPGGGTGPGGGPRPSSPAEAAQLPGLCRAYLAKSAEGRERALRTPGFRVLVEAAGGADQVADYCGRLTPAGESSPAPRASRTPPVTGPPAKGRPSASPAGRKSTPAAANRATPAAATNRATPAPANRPSPPGVVPPAGRQDG